jgi:hypothetical protein
LQPHLIQPMLSLQGITELLNDKGRQRSREIEKWRWIYYGMSLHIDGACPAFVFNRNGIDAPVYPTNYFGLEYQYLFDVFLLNRHPRENEKTRQWRLSQYKPFTQDPFLRVISVTTGAIFQDSGYSIEIENQRDSEYIWGENFQGKNLPNYISSQFQYIAEDPNGLFVVIPKNQRNVGTSEPDVWFVCSKHIEHHTRDEVIFHRDGYMWCVNRIGYFRFEEREHEWINVDGNDGYYAHMLGYIPAYRAGGLQNGQGFLDSWLTAAKAVADEYISAKSAEQLVNKEASHPFIQAASEDCPDCTNGQVQWCVTCNCVSENCQCGNSYENYGMHSCLRCGGKGEISRNPGDWIIAPVEDMDKDLVRFHNPDTGINTFHAENNNNIFLSLMRALHLNYIEQAQSGTAKDKDMETRYQFILSICNDLFDRLLYNIIRDILALRNVSTANGFTRPTAPAFTIVKPTQFQIKTSYDLLMEYKEATDSGLPDFMRVQNLEAYADKQFGGDDVLKKKTKVITELDILAVKSDADIQIVLLNGAATNRDYQYHLRLPKILDALVRTKTNDWFLNASIEDIGIEVEREFAKVIPPVIQVRPEVEERVNL